MTFSIILLCILVCSLSKACLIHGSEDNSYGDDSSHDGSDESDGNSFQHKERNNEFQSMRNVIDFRPVSWYNENPNARLTIKALKRYREVMAVDRILGNSRCFSLCVLFEIASITLTICCISAHHIDFIAWPGKFPLPEVLEPIAIWITDKAFICILMAMIFQYGFLLIDLYKYHEFMAIFYSIHRVNKPALICLTIWYTFYTYIYMSVIHVSDSSDRLRLSFIPLVMTFISISMKHNTALMATLFILLIVQIVCLTRIACHSSADISPVKYPSAYGQTYVNITMMVAYLAYLTVDAKILSYMSGEDTEANRNLIQE